MLRLLLFALSSSLLLAGTPDVEVIMAKVAANQYRAIEQRNTYTYTQKVRAKTLRRNDKLSREEHASSRDPTTTGTKKGLVQLTGRYRTKANSLN